MAQELAPFNIRVAVVEPGVTKSAIFAKNPDVPQTTGAYEPAYRRMFQFYAAGIPQATDPLEVAEAIQHLPQRPQRSILIAFWDGEEKGLLGSYHFLRVAPEGLAGRRVALSVNLDMIGRLRGGRLEVYGTRTAHGLRETVVQANSRPSHAAGLDLAFVWDIEDDSDHYPFITARVPTVMFHTGLHDNYHRPSDDVQLINLEGIEPVARLTLGFVTAVANDAAPIPAYRDRAWGESNVTRNRV
jgi:Zn-dependent M28 family amino/carboxypeptidase